MAPIPGPVPVMIIVPRSKVVPCDKKAIVFAILNIISLRKESVTISLGVIFIYRLVPCVGVLNDCSVMDSLDGQFVRIPNRRS